MCHVILVGAMSGPTILVIADPAAPYLKALATIPEHVHLIVSNDLERVTEAAPEADALFYAETHPALLHAVLPLAKKVRWIHVMWTGVEGVLKDEMLSHPAPLSNGRGVFRRPSLADWVAAVALPAACVRPGPGDPTTTSRRLAKLHRRSPAGEDSRDRRVWEPGRAAAGTGSRYSG